MAVAHAFARADGPRLDHRQVQRHDRTRIREWQPAIQTDPRPGQVEVVVRPQEDAAGRRKAARRGDAVGHRPELGQLGRVRRMAGLVGVGQVRHDERRARAAIGLGGQRLGPHGRPFRPLHPQPVHAGIKLDGERPLRPRDPVAEELLGAVQDRDQPIQIGIFRERPRQHEDARVGCQQRADRPPLVRQRHEEIARAGGIKRGRNLRRAGAVGVRLQHRGGSRGGRARRKAAPVGHDRIKADVQSHAD